MILKNSDAFKRLILLVAFFSRGLNYVLRDWDLTVNPTETNKHATESAKHNHPCLQPSVPERVWVNGRATGRCWVPLLNIPLVECIVICNLEHGALHCLWEMRVGWRVRAPNRAGLIRIGHRRVNSITEARALAALGNRISV